MINVNIQWALQLTNKKLWERESVTRELDYSYLHFSLCNHFCPFPSPLPTLVLWIKSIISLESTAFFNLQSCSREWQQIPCSLNSRQLGLPLWAGWIVLPFHRAGSKVPEALLEPGVGAGLTGRGGNNNGICRKFFSRNINFPFIKLKERKL